MSKTLTGFGVTYNGDPGVLGGNFVDQYKPVPGKSDWGMDTMSVLVRGIAPNLANFVAGLVQGQTRTFNGQVFYLQSWEPDNGPVFPGVTLHYKGLIGGIPPPKADGQNIEVSVSIAGSEIAVANDEHGNPNGGYQSATREIRYVTRSSRTRYITSARPGGASYGLDIQTSPYILSSVIRAVEYVDIYYPPGTTDYDSFPPATATRTYSGGTAPAALVSALTPASAVQSFVECSPVVGSPYFECTDSASLLFAGG